MALKKTVITTHGFEAVDGDNPIKQAYDQIKKTADFITAKDC